MLGRGKLNSTNDSQMMVSAFLLALRAVRDSGALRLNGSHEANHLLSHRHLPDLTTTWGYEISSAYRGSTAEREAKPGARPISSKEGWSTLQVCLARNQTSGSNPRSPQRLFLRPHKTEPAVCGRLYSCGFI